MVPQPAYPVRRHAGRGDMGNRPFLHQRQRYGDRDHDISLGLRVCLSAGEPGYPENVPYHLADVCSVGRQSGFVEGARIHGKRDPAIR